MTDKHYEYRTYGSTGNLISFADDARYIVDRLSGKSARECSNWFNGLLAFACRRQTEDFLVKAVHIDSLLREKDIVVEIHEEFRERWSNAVRAVASI